jgi:glucose/arabinose dehydrogenase
MMRQLPVLLMLALAASSCSVQPQQEAPPIANPAGPALPPVTSLPDNAPAGTVKNVPATTGRANVPRTPSPFAVATIGQFDEPFALAFLPDGRLLVTEKAGALKLRATDGQVTSVRGVPPVAAGGQGGLLDIAPAPDFADSHRIYLSYSEPRASGSSLALMRAVLTDSGSGATLTKPQILCRVGRGWRAIRCDHRFRARRPIVVSNLGRTTALHACAGPRSSVGQDRASVPQRQTRAGQSNGQCRRG